MAPRLRPNLRFGEPRTDDPRTTVTLTLTETPASGPSAALRLTDAEVREHLVQLLGAKVLTGDEARSAVQPRRGRVGAATAVPVAVVRPRPHRGGRRPSSGSAREHGVPVVARGAGTGLSGGANAVDGCVVLSLERMDRDPRDRPRRAARRRRSPASSTTTSARPCAEHGLWYPPDPASAPWSTIGGNVATNAGGAVLRQVRRDPRLRARRSRSSPADRRGRPARPAYRQGRRRLRPGRR